ncbi:MAG: hypothetical protein HKO53_02760 [Gemmatimonadetes bacterium]|nr:hypothetical protein [Gemmatimonadota bacterium]
MGWAKLGGANAADVIDTRLVVHWAAQVVASVGAAHIPPQADDSHRNLGWSPTHRALLGHPSPAGLQVGIRPEPFALLVVGPSGAIAEEIALPGLTLDAAFQRVREAIAFHGGKDAELARPEYDLPPHPVADGAEFPALAAGDELARWFAGADHLLEKVRAEHHAASVRCWPHHFDLATLITLEASGDAEKSKTVGVGMTPGDSGYPDPYWYVTPWPYPEDPKLGDLPRGHWHTEGWVGAVLTGPDTVAAGDDQEAAVLSFLDAAIQHGRRMIQEAS